MRYETHLATSLAAGSTLTMITAVPFTFAYVTGILIGCLLPDIDEPKSFVGRRSFGISSVIKQKYGHRGITHSLFTWLVFSILVLLLFHNFFGFGLSLGYLFHIFGDLFSVSGVPLYKPFYLKKVKMPVYLTYKTSSTKETVIFSVSLFLLILVIPQTLKQPFIHSFQLFIEAVFELLSKI